MRAGRSSSSERNGATACATAGCSRQRRCSAALALTLAFLGAAPTGDGQGQRARGDDRQPVQPDDLSGPVDRACCCPMTPSSARSTAARWRCCLSYPVARWQVMLGKFAGHLAILGFATVVGYGVAGSGPAMGRQRRSRRMVARSRHDRDVLDAARRCLRRHRLFRQYAGSRPRHGRRHRHRRLAVLRAALRHGAARRAGGRPGPNGDGRRC